MRSSSSSILYGAHLLLGLLMWTHIFPCLVNGQSTAATSTARTSGAAAATSAGAATSTAAVATTSASGAATSTTTAAVTTSAASSAAATGKPYLTIHNVETMTACGLGRIYWNVYNEDDSKVNITIYAVNAGVDQDVPSASATPTSAASTSAAATSQRTSSAVTSGAAATSSAAHSTTAAAASTAVANATLSRRTNLNINRTIITQLANHGYDWESVALPEGRYYIYGYVDDGYGTSNTSNIFSVIEGSNTSCLAAYESMSKTATATGQASQSATLGAGTSDSGASESSSGIGGGAIAGIVIGVLAGLGALAALAFFSLRKHRRDRTFGNRWDGDDHQMGMTHRRVISGSTAPSDPGHSPGYNSIGMGNKGMDKGETVGNTVVIGALRKDGSYNSSRTQASAEGMGRTVEEMPVPPAMTDQFTTDGEKDDQEVLQDGSSQGHDPFKTPTIPELSFQPTQHSQPVFSPIETDSNRHLSSDPIPPPPIAARNSISQPRTSLSESQPSQPRPTSQVHTRRKASQGSMGPGDSPNPNTGGSGLGRSNSTRRKPVPSLGPELRGELARQASLKTKEEGAKAMPQVGLGLKQSQEAVRNEEGQKSYVLMPDPPMPQN
ncbi:hypothetical protein C359_05545 [Cryptococcus neoformans Bt120]|nr:hypothetical protein C359_05545 [Cryptococcus neoformans var. grubii Bt120]